MVIIPDLLCNNLMITSPEINKYFIDHFASYQASLWLIKMESHVFSTVILLNPWLMFLIQKLPNFNKTCNTCFYFVYPVFRLIGSVQGFRSYGFKFLLDKENWSLQLLLRKKWPHCFITLQINWALFHCGGCDIRCYAMSWPGFQLLLQNNAYKFCIMPVIPVWVSQIPKGFSDRPRWSLRYLA